jgi:hypothetical protein
MSHRIPLETPHLVLFFLVTTRITQKNLTTGVLLYIEARAMGKSTARDGTVLYPSGLKDVVIRNFYLQELALCKSQVR